MSFLLCVSLPESPFNSTFVFTLASPPLATHIKQGPTPNSHSRSRSSMEVGASVWVADAGPETWLEGTVVAKVRESDGGCLWPRPREGQKDRRARRLTCTACAIAHTNNTFFSHQPALCSGPWMVVEAKEGSSMTWRSSCWAGKEKGRRSGS